MSDSNESRYASPLKMHAAPSSPDRRPGAFLINNPSDGSLGAFLIRPARKQANDKSEESRTGLFLI